jgi:C1A family cysteine protease
MYLLFIFLFIALGLFLFALKFGSKKHSFGCKLDSFDDRDFVYGIGPSISLPESIDLSSECTDIVDQGQSSSCTSNATISGLYEFLRLQKKIVDTDRFSRLFHYFCERAYEGTEDKDEGATIRDAMKALAQRGVCYEKTWPFIIKLFAKKPSVESYNEALDHKVSSYSRLNNLTNLKQCLASKNVAVIGIKIYESFESTAVSKTGVIPMPKDTENLLGGHAVCTVGYNDKTSMLKVRNSWGKNWGDKGYFYIPYDVFDEIAMDMWTAVI